MKTEKLLLYGGVAVGGLLLLNFISTRAPVSNPYAYRGLIPGTPAYNAAYGQNNTLNQVTQGVTAATPLLTDIFDNLFGDSNSGTAGATSYDYVPNTGMGGDVMSGIGCIMCQGGAMS